MENTINRIGFWAGLLAFTATIGYCIVQLLQVYGLLAYPTDERLIFGTSLCIVVPFVIEMLALHYTTPDYKKFWSHAALIFTTMYAVFVTLNYTVQLATVIPMTMNGKLDEVRVLQQLPHSMFWDFDALGYISMGFACFAAIPLFDLKGSRKWLKISLIAHAAVTPLITIVYFYPKFSLDLLILGYPWAVTAPLFMILLALNFKNNLKEKNALGNDVKSLHTPVRHTVLFRKY